MSASFSRKACRLRFGWACALVLMRCPASWALVISEIQYRPPTGQESLEFVELTNDAFSPEDVSGWAFVEGVRFVVPPGTILRGGETLVLCADVDAVIAQYNPRRAIGNYEGSLDAGGERLTLVTQAGVIVQSLRYRDRGEWPVGADGTGHSIVVTNIHADSSDPRHWARSPELGGSPGEANFVEDRIGFRDEVFFDFDQPWLYRRGTEPFSEPPESWRDVAFDDSAWESGLPGFGFGDDDDTTVFDDMPGNYSSVALRLHVTLTEAEVNEFVLPVLEINYDDGFCAFFNDVEFARRNCPDEIAWNRSATDGREARPGLVELLEVPRKAVRVGDNVLAIVGYNRTIVDNDFSLIPRLLLRRSDAVVPVEQADVVFNELARVPGGDSWVELYNAESGLRDLSGWTLSDDPDRAAAYTFPEGTTIGPGRFLALGAMESGLSLAEPTVALCLRSPSGVVLAATVFDRTPPPSLDGAAFAEVRYPDGDREGWLTPTLTRAAPNDVPFVSDIVINEIFYHPPEDRTGEFIELYHRGVPLAEGGVAVDLSGFRFTDGVDFTFPEGSTISPGEYVVVAQDPALLVEHYAYSGAVGPFDGVLANGGERLRLVDTLGNPVDTVRYDDGGDWPGVADGRGASLELIDPQQENDVAGAWGPSDASQKASWEEHVFTIADPVHARHPELRLLLIERGECLVDDLQLTHEIQEVETLLDSGAEWRFRRGVRAFSQPPDAWYAADFDDSSWEVGRSGFGFGDDDDLTVLEDMRLGYTTLAIRTKVMLSEEEVDAQVLLGMKYDDGFCVFVNGEAVVCENGPEVVDWSLTAPRSHESREEEFFEIPAGVLTPGENTLAIVGFNRSVSDSDFTLDPRLVRATGVRDSENLIAHGDFETDTSPWLFRGTHRTSDRVTTDAFSGEGSLRIVATSKGDGQCNGTEMDLDAPIEAGRTHKLSIATKWQSGASVLIVSGGFGGGVWPTPREVNLSGNSVAAAVRMTIPRDLGTPGTENSLRRALRELTGSDNQGPVFADVLHDPPVPLPQEPVTVRARVVDSDGVAEVRLFFRRDTSPSNEGGLDEGGLDGGGLDGGKATEFTSLALLPVGGDVYANDLPPTGEAGRVLFYFEAEDGAGALGTYPAGAPGRTLVYRADPEPTESLHVTQAAQPFNFSGLLSNDLVDGTVVHDDEIFYNVGMRHRGSPWGRQSLESLRLRFPKDHLFKGNRRDINLSIRDRVSDGPAHFLTARNSTPAHIAPSSDYKYITARVNGESWGVPGLFEPYDRRFIAKWFGDEAAAGGVLLKANGRLSFEDDCREFLWDGAALHHRGGEVENHRFYYTHGIHQSRDNWEPFLRLTGLLDTTKTDVETLDREFESVVDFPSFIRTLGPRMVAGDGDALFVGNGHNGYVYWDPTEDLWHYIAIDFGGFNFQVGNDLLGVVEPNMSRLVRRPRATRIYYDMLDEYMHGYWNPEVAGPYFQALFEATGVSDQGNLAGSHDTVVRRIRPFVEAPLRLLTSDGQELTEDVHATGPEVTLQGEAPVTMTSLILQEEGGQGVAFEPTFTSATEWSVNLAIGPGTTVFQILGFHRTGALIGTTSVTVVVPEGNEFIRGDVDGNAKFNIRDPVGTLAALFRDGPLPCPDASDVNDDGRVDITDVLGSLEFIFVRGAPPPPPFPAAGLDPTEDILGCRR